MLKVETEVLFTNSSAFLGLLGRELLAGRLATGRLASGLLEEER